MIVQSESPNGTLTGGWDWLSGNWATTCPATTPAYNCRPWQSATVDVNGNVLITGQSGDQYTGQLSADGNSISGTFNQPTGSADYGTWTVSRTQMCATPKVAPVFPGTSWTQVDPVWTALPYDNANPPKNTIGSAGCLLTSLAYSMTAAGETFSPVTLNAKLDAIPGDYTAPIGNTPSTGGRIIAARSVITASKSSLKLDTTYQSSSTTTDLDANLCDPVTPRPVIVGVNGNTHYVVVTAKNADGSYTIVDPGFFHTPVTKLSAYNNNFQIVGVVKPPLGTDPSELDLSILNNATMIVTAPDGTQTGIDPSTGASVKGSPNAAYFVVNNAVDSEDEMSPATETMYSVQMFLPANGTYTVRVQGLQLGPYNLTIQSLDANGNPQPSTILPGIANVGSTSIFQVQYSSATGATSTVTPMATFASTQADIYNGTRAGLIRSQLDADILRDIVNVAEWASDQHTEDGYIAERFALAVFERVVVQQSGKQLSGVAPQVLTNDAASLISQIPPMQH